ncbi:MAG: lipid-A-disaccharide synthase [Alphaproteobacteria bacterium]|nr:lipid-A-disaccharide synthase [Alphaproteobacteria bacterium]
MPTNNAPTLIYLIAGEPSGDLLGAHLMRALKAASKDKPIMFFGIGGDLMAKEGLRSLFPYHDLAVMGFAELLPHAMKLLARIDQTVEDIRRKEPHAVITIDSPGFCKRVVKKLRKEKFETRFIHYVAPSVWAWKPERARSFAQLFDHLLALLPFEPPYFEKEGLGTTFVGHPVVAETKTGDGSAFRARYELAPDTVLFAVLPGSRAGEIRRHLPIFARAITLLSEAYPRLAIFIPVPKHLLPMVKPYFDDCPFRAIVSAKPEDKLDGIAASNAAIVKSGTVSLEVAKSHVPMVIAYRVSILSALIFKRLRLIKLVTLVNILLEREAIPELLQDDCNPLLIATAAAQLLQNPAMAEAQKAAIDQAFAMLAPKQSLPSDIAARAVLGQLGQIDN